MIRGGPVHSIPLHRSRRRLQAVLAALVLGGLWAVPLTSANAAGGSFPAHYSAPYLQITGGDAGDMASDRNATGDSYYTLAFLIPRSGCTMQWEDNGDPVGAFTSQVSSLQAAGGNVIISFGGEAGGEVA